MTRTTKLAAWLVGIGAVLIASGCSDDANLGRNTLGTNLTTEAQRGGGEKIQTFWGKPEHLGDGLARTYIQIDAQGTPASIGIEMTMKALQDLPQTAESLVLMLPKRAEDLTQFTHVLLDWNPQGHPPGPYEVPHFDFHFYMQSIQAREAITAADVAGFALAPAPQYIPSAYLQTPGGVPQMGTHWVDLLSPELNGAPFTTTFIWGTFNGQVTFFEPMITRDYLLSRPDVTIPLRQPVAFQETGYYPTSYSVMFQEHPAAVLISLNGLTYRTAS